MGRVEVNVPELFGLWSTAMSNEDIAKAIGVARSTLDILRIRHGLPKRRLKRRCPSDYAESPTPEEIAERAAEVRAGWPEGEAERRMVGASPTQWRLPSFAFRPREHSFSEVCGY